MSAPDDGQDPTVLLQAITRKLASSDDPRQMRELTQLAIDLLLRRRQDKALHDQLIARIDAALAGVDGVDPLRRQMAALTCTELLTAAREHRPPRDMRWQSAERPETPPPSAPAVRKAPPTPWPVAAAGTTLVAATLAGIVLLLWPSLLPPLAPPPASAATLARTIAGPAPALAPALGAMRLHEARDGGGRPLVIAESVPRRLCPTTAILLARDGAVTVNGVRPGRPTIREMEHLCFTRDGDADFTWTATAPATDEEGGQPHR